MTNQWDCWVEEALKKLHNSKRLRSQVPLQTGGAENTFDNEEMEFYEGPGPWDRSSVEFKFHNRNILLFSGNDYLALSTHPAVRNASAKAAQRHGMGPRGSALICGYTHFHRLLESALAELKQKEESLLCPTGFSANMALLTGIGSISSLLSSSGRPTDHEKIAIFSDALNHASIIDGIHLTERRGEAKAYVFRHCDTTHLDEMLSDCRIEKKVVITDSLFSMDGDFAPMVDLVALRKKHGFLLVIDDAHGTLTCGRHGRGVAEKFNVEKDIDICIGTLSKAAGCNGGFIACSKSWKTLIQSRGRSFIFSTALPVPAVAAAYAAIIVAKREKWRRMAVWQRVEEFKSTTGLHASSPIVPIIIGEEEHALWASKCLIGSGFHVTAIRPPTVPRNLSRLRITLSAAHTTADVKDIANILKHCINLLKSKGRISKELISYENTPKNTKDLMVDENQVEEFLKEKLKSSESSFPKTASKL